MKKLFLVLAFSACITSAGFAQSVVKYKVSFRNVKHHEAEVSVEYNDLDRIPFEIRMSRSSPGRYALHEFAKNVYNVNAYDSQGNKLEIRRPNPYQWNVFGHDGTVKVTYTLFANHGDGTYSQFDETHAHMNVPATFMYSKGHDSRPIEVEIIVPENLKWQVATQLEEKGGNVFAAPDFQYFMDSPIEVSDFMMREYQVRSNEKKYTIRLALHHTGSQEEADLFFEQVKEVVDTEIQVYGELPDFDFGSYTFIACYMPNVSGDGMEHRNSTICTSTRSLASGGMRNNIGTIAHEFFHSWNVERLRPKSLEPFDFNRVNMSGELWLAEGFTSYYSGLVLCRAGLRSPEEYVGGLSRSLNYIINSPGRNYFNPIEMSYQAPFVDAARSVDPTNRNNTFISYYNYGSVLALALDLSLREMDTGLNLDEFMQLLYGKYGKTEIPYTLKDVILSLGEYAGKSFTSHFFTNYIYDSKVPDYEMLLASVGVDYSLTDPDEPWWGAFIRFDNGYWQIARSTTVGGPAYLAGLEEGDIILKVNDAVIAESDYFMDGLNHYKIGDKIKISYSRLGRKRVTELTIGQNPTISTTLDEKVSKRKSSKELKRRNVWLRIHN